MFKQEDVDRPTKSKQTTITMSEKRQCCDTTITRIAMNVTFQLLSAICGALMASVGVLRFISLPALGNSGAFQATVPGVIIAVWVMYVNVFTTNFF